MKHYERAMCSSYRDNFDNIRIRGCSFHFSQFIWRKIQAIPDIRELYCNHPTFALNVRQLLSLAFVPILQVIAKFEELLTFVFFVENEDLLRPATILKTLGLVGLTEMVQEDSHYLNCIIGISLKMHHKICRKLTMRLKGGIKPFSCNLQVDMFPYGN